MCFTNNERLELNQNLAALEDPQAKCLTLAGLYQSYGQLGASVLQELGLNDEAVKAVRLLEADASRLPHMAGVVQAATAKGYIPNPQGKKREEVIAEAKEHPYVKTMYDIYGTLGASPELKASLKDLDKFFANYLNGGHDLYDFSRHFEVVNEPGIIAVTPQNSGLSGAQLKTFAATAIEKLAPPLIQYLRDNTGVNISLTEMRRHIKWLSLCDGVFTLANTRLNIPVYSNDGGIIAFDTEDIKDILGLNRPGFLPTNKEARQWNR